MILALVAIAMADCSPIDIQSKVMSRLVVSEGRLSERSKSVFASLVSSNLASAKLSRKMRIDAQQKRNTDARVRVQNAPKARRIIGKEIKKAPKELPKRTDVVTNYIANVRLKIQNEHGQPIDGSLVQVDGAATTRSIFAIASHPSFAVGGWKSASGLGYMNLYEVKVPGTIKIKITHGRTDEWTLSGDQQEIPITIPETETALVQEWKEGQPRKHAFYLDKDQKITKDKSKATVEVLEAVTTRRIDLELQEPVVIRREVADFVVRIPNGVIGTKMFLGEKPIEAKLANGRMELQLKRDEIGESDTTLVVQADTAEAGFGCTLKIEKPNFYSLNELEANLELESIPEGNVVLAGKRVDESFPLSPLHWRSESSRLFANLGIDSGFDYRPRISTGASAMEILGIDSKAVRDVTPGPQNERGRYGRWLWIDSLGLGLHCRFDPDDRKAWKPMEAAALRNSSKGKYLPHKDTYGILESIRVTSPKGGQIGSALYVGANRTTLEQVFGKCDTFLNQSQMEQIGIFSGSQRNRAVMGDESIECWDDTYLHGGVRIKWNEGKVKWFEISRPIQLIFNGTRAFDPPEVQTIALKQATTSNSTYQSEFESNIRAMLSKSSGLRFIYDWENADVVASATLSTNIGNPTAAQHSYIVDAGKKRERTVKERFLCPEVTVGVEVRVSLNGAEGELQHIRHPDSLELGSSLGHVPDKQCVNDVPQSLRSLVYSAMSSRSLARSITNAGATFSDMTGTVIAVNWQNGLILINLGKVHGIRAKPDSEMTELNMYLLHEVDPKTGAGGERSSIQNECIMGRPAFGEWLEVLSVGEDWCVAQPKKKGGRGTATAYDVLPRVMDPGSGLVRVTISKKSGG